MEEEGLCHLGFTRSRAVLFVEVANVEKNAANMEVAVCQTPLSKVPSNQAFTKLNFSSSNISYFQCLVLLQQVRDKQASPRPEQPLCPQSTRKRLDALPLLLIIVELDFISLLRLN